MEESPWLTRLMLISVLLGFAMFLGLEFDRIARLLAN